MMLGTTYLTTTTLGKTYKASARYYLITTKFFQSNK
jgi:hypothetical protein